VSVCFDDLFPSTETGIADEQALQKIKYFIITAVLELLSDDNYLKYRKTQEKFMLKINLCFGPVNNSCWEHFPL
jgi:hypothetical protein